MKKLLYLSLLTLAFWCTAEAQPGRNLFKSDFTKGLSQFPSLEILDARALVVTDSIKRFGQKSIRSEVAFGNNDIKSIRSEISFTPETQAEGWYGLSIFAPSNYLPDPDPEIVTQWHDMPDFKLGEDWISPSLSLRVQDGDWNFDVRYDTAKVTKQGKWMAYIPKDLGPVKLNAWTDWVFHIKFSYKADGLVEVYKNGVKVYTRNGPNGYNDEKYPYWKVGIYKWLYKVHDKPHLRNHRLLYYSQIKKNDGPDATYNDVAPK